MTHAHLRYGLPGLYTEFPIWDLSELDITAYTVLLLIVPDWEMLLALAFSWPIAHAAASSSSPVHSAARSIKEL